ncbi:hypothetical protein M4578_06390 [Salipiger sp. P9]|uniref:hypothetical protein n=1 Tax=Salipiger pentaromativorans TaxID=2943193 RepID=UPI00215716BE|nr:hypothetical protein [Salipiger pentaromativorans]MCR8547449.1 hypothetical protein [Salipiger pentaromativorans]
MFRATKRPSHSADVGGFRIELRRRAEDSAALRALTRICPSACFRFGESDRIEFSSENCTLCGTCRRVCGATGEIAWFAPERIGAPARRLA